MVLISAESVEPSGHSLVPLPRFALPGLTRLFSCPLVIQILSRLPAETYRSPAESNRCLLALARNPICV